MRVSSDSQCYEIIMGLIPHALSVIGVTVVCE